MRKKTFWCHLLCLKVYALKSGSSYYTYPSTGTLTGLCPSLLKQHRTQFASSFPAAESPWLAEDRVSLPARQKCLGIPDRRSQIPLWYSLWAQQNNFYSASVQYEPSGNSQISHSSEATIRAPLSRSLRTAQFQRFQSGNLPVWLLQVTSS